MNNVAPSDRGLILYKGYGNLYAMTGRKAHLLEDKQIPSVGVFDEVLLIGGSTGTMLETLNVVGDTHNGHLNDVSANEKQQQSIYSSRRNIYLAVVSDCRYVAVNETNNSMIVLMVTPTKPFSPNLGRNPF
ncbi:hypothetical protein Tco_1233175 [Tanacetum coccineum]